jgi:hypothetical protein
MYRLGDEEDAEGAYACHTTEYKQYVKSDSQDWSLMYIA